MRSRTEKVFLRPLLQWGRGLRKSDKSSCWLTNENVKRLEMEAKIKHFLGTENSRLAEEGDSGLSASWSEQFPSLLNVPDPFFFFPHLPGKYFYPGKASFIWLPGVPQCADLKVRTVMAISLEQPWGLSSGQLPPPAGQSPEPSPAAHLFCHPGSSGLSAVASLRAVMSGQLQSLHVAACGETGGCQQPLMGPTAVKRQPPSFCPFLIVSPRHALAGAGCL